MILACDCGLSLFPGLPIPHGMATRRSPLLPFASHMQTKLDAGPKGETEITGPPGFQGDGGEGKLVVAVVPNLGFKHYSNQKLVLQAFNPSTMTKSSLRWESQ